MPRKRRKTPKPKPTAPLISEGIKEQYFFLPLTIILAAVAYFLTLCPTVFIGDSGELASAAYYLGIPHSPGYPLYCLIGWVFTHLPIGDDIAYRLNLMSAFFGVGTTLILYMIVYHFTRTPYLSFSISLAYAFSPIFWSQAVVAEVYTLNTFLTALALFFMCKWVEKRNDIWLYSASFVIGLAMTNHQLSFLLVPTGLYMLWLFAKKHTSNLFLRIILIFLASLAVVITIRSLEILTFEDPFSRYGSVLIILALILWPMFKDMNRPLKFWLITAGCFIAGLLVYLYLPIRAAADPPMNWGDPSTFKGFLTTVLKPASSQGNQGDIIGHIGYMFYQWVIQFSPYIAVGSVKYPIPIIWAFGLWGIYKGLATSWRMARVFIAFILFNILTILLITKRSGDEFILLGVYYLPVFLVFAVFMATGIREWLQTFFKAFGEKKRPVLLGLVILILVLIPVNQFIQNRIETDRSHDYYARDHATTLLTECPPDSILVVLWDDIFTIWYLQQVEFLRTDVIPVIAELPAGPDTGYWGRWYINQLNEEHPEIFEGYDLDNAIFRNAEEALNAFVVNNLGNGRDVYFSFHGLVYNFELFEFRVWPVGPIFQASMDEYSIKDLVEAREAWERVLGSFRNIYNYSEHMHVEEDFIIARVSDNLLKCGILALQFDSIGADRTLQEASLENVNFRVLAEWFLDQSMQVNPLNFDAVFELANLRYQAERYTEAKNLYLDALEIYPANVEAHMNLARIYIEIEQYELARQSLVNVLQLDPYQPEARAMLELLDQM